MAFLFYLSVRFWAGATQSSDFFSPARAILFLDATAIQEAVFISIAHCPRGLFARILRCFPLQSVRIAAENRLVCGAKNLVIRCTLLTKTASER